MFNMHLRLYYTSYALAEVFANSARRLLLQYNFNGIVLDMQPRMRSRAYMRLLQVALEIFFEN